MTTYHAQIGFPCDSALPRDVMTINPHYDGDSPQGLADVLVANLKANANIGATAPMTVKIYDAKKPPPSYPLATAVNGTGFLTTGWPREVALCLSYYASFNRPGFRGRLYLPQFMWGGALGQRPTTTQRTNAGLIANALFKGLPSGTIAVVFSKKAQTTAPINNWWVDDEWDTVRSRGQRPTARTTGTVP